MAVDFDIGDKLPPLVNRIVTSYREDPRTRHIGRVFFPSRAQIIELIERLLELIYPGFVGRQNLTDHNIAFHVGELLPRIGQLAHHQIYQSLCYAEYLDREGPPDELPGDGKARELTHAFLERLPTIRSALADDVQAAVDGDPAVTNSDEVILAYPGQLAVTVYRLAHELHTLGVPLMPRFMTEWAHQMTGIDIHPGAAIGQSFFIDHGTGVVIGETTHIGDQVKLYQGVTLGAISFPKDDRGRVVRQEKRHPTVEDHVTVYASATILGGDTVIGAHSVIGGSVFLTSSVPPWSTVTMNIPDLRIKGPDGKRRTPTDSDHIHFPDYQI
ncbi:MAG: serine acetyltransferase [Planctomycetes bacterium]|nr:serine acetyltransferase [Planctomycetota bacterium]